MKALLKAFFDNKIALYSVLVLVPFLTYVKACYFDFSPLDDVWLIINNEEIIKNWSNLKEAFRQATSEMYYRPLLFDSFIIDYHIKGLNAHVFHFTNVVLHVLTVLLLFRFLKQYDVRKELAFVFALLFALHPVMLHAVAWVPGRNDVMLALFCLAALYFQNLFLDRSQKKYVVLQFVFFILALFTKETAIVMPVVFALNSYAKGIEKRKIGVEFVFTLIITIAWYYYRKTIVKDVGFMDGDLALRLKNFVSSFLIYNGKVIYPFQQSLYPTIENSHVLFGLISILIMIAMIRFFKFSSKRYGYLGIALYLLFLFVPIWFVSASVTREQYENRLYTPMIGLVLFAANLKIDWENQVTRLCFGALIIFYFSTTFVRMENYRDYMIYIEKCIDDNPNNYFFHERMADELAARSDLKGAVKHYSEAIRILPSRALFYNNRANVYTSLGMKEEALRDFDSAIVRSGNDPRVYLNRCMTLVKLNEFDAAMSELNKLKQCCQQMIPPEAEKEIVMRWTMNGFDKVNELLSKQPNNAVLYANRAKLYYDMGRKNEALADKQKALSLAPENDQIKKYLEFIVP
jgi:tetratricopeptide (TPR) repeat protein